MALRSRGERIWLVAFAVSILSLAGSLAGLGIVLSNRGSADAARGSAPASASDSARTAVPGVSGLTYTGALPANYHPTNLHQAPPGKSADIVISDREGPSSVVVTYFVPVTAWGAGLDATTSENLRSLLEGRVADWRAVGGVAGKVVVAVAGPEADQATVRLLFPGLQAALTFATYQEMKAAMTLNSGIVGLLPREEVTVSVEALAIDGLDLIRGAGEPEKWPYVRRVTVEAKTDNGAKAKSAIVDAIRAKVPDAINIVATGDILMSRCALTHIISTGDWASPLRGPVGDYLRSADLALGSLDGSIQDASPVYGCVETTNLSSPPQVMEALTYAGFDEMTIATNHVFDCGQRFCGREAFYQTIDRLRAAGIAVVGGGRDLKEALAGTVLEAKGLRVAVLGFDDVAAQDLEATDTAPGTAPMDDDYSEERKANEPAFYRPASELAVTRLVDRVRAMKLVADVVIVQIQSGTEDTHDPTERSIKALRAAAAAGATLVIGNQAHWAQAVETRDDAFIAYALGNFIFDQIHTPEHTQGYLVQATYAEKKLVNVRLVPYQIATQYKPTFVDGALRAKIETDVFEAAAKLPK
jgi:poly-gamma-glutamate capsule biosynthesis protein CapA/YwtB (metallophosphatase superfamily)